MLPLAAPARQRELLTRLLDPACMQAVFQLELSRLTPSAIQVTSCRIKLRRRRVAVREERLELLYEVGVVAGAGPERKYVLLGTAPEQASFSAHEHGADVLAHPALVPFHVPSAFVEEFQLGLRFFPLDPCLPGLALLTGPRGAEILAPHLSAWRAGVALTHAECELRQYKPFKRAVVRVTAHLADGRSRALYAKLFADPRGERSQRELAALWAATRTARGLRMPEPLGYDPSARALFLSEAAGQGDLTEWIKCLEKGRDLPAGVDLARLERCMAVAAQALADLQGSGVRVERTRTRASALAGLRRDHAVLCRKLPGDASLNALGGLLTLLDDRLADTAVLVPAHACFRHKQMVGDESSLTLVDWDGLCMADGALDAATFVGRLRSEPLRHGGEPAALEHLADTFRRAFLALRPGVSTRALAAQECLVIVEDLLRSFRRPGRAAGMAREIEALMAAARTLLARA